MKRKENKPELGHEFFALCLMRGETLAKQVLKNMKNVARELNFRAENATKEVRIGQGIIAHDATSGRTMSEGVKGVFSLRERLGNNENKERNLLFYVHCSENSGVRKRAKMIKRIVRAVDDLNETGHFEGVIIAKKLAIKGLKRGNVEHF